MSGERVEQLTRRREKGELEHTHLTFHLNSQILFVIGIVNKALPLRVVQVSICIVNNWISKQPIRVLDFKLGAGPKPNPGFEINGCPVVPDNQKYAGTTK